MKPPQAEKGKLYLPHNAPPHIPGVCANESAFIFPNTSRKGKLLRQEQRKPARYTRQRQHVRRKGLRGWGTLLLLKGFWKTHLSDRPGRGVPTSVSGELNGQPLFSLTYDGREIPIFVENCLDLNVCCCSNN